MLRLIRCAIGVGLLCAATAQASTTVIDFNSDPAALGITPSGSALWIASGGLAYDPSTNASDGYLQITPAVNGQSGTVVFPDFDNGSIVQGFTFDCWVRIGNGTTTPADGFSISYSRTSTPAFNNGAGEEGTTTGIAVGFDAYDNGAGDPRALDIWVDGVQVFQFAMPNLNGSVTDPTSLQTGPNDGTYSPDSLGWAHCVVSLSTNGLLNVYYKDTHILTDYATGYLPGPGQLVMAGRTGDLNENQDVDQITITTILAALAQFAPTATGLADGASIQIYDSGASVVDTTKPMTFSINGGPAEAATSAQKNGTTTTVTYHGFPTLLPVGSTNQFVVTVHDTHDNAITATRTFVVPKYSALLPAWAISSGVNTNLPGFRLQPWQSPDTAGVGEPNASYWAQEQLAGLHGANNADLSSATDGGYVDYTSVINFNAFPASAGYNDAGNFQTGNGYADSLIPGIPGSNGLTGSTALEVLTFLQFTKAGTYTMGVNSDDGFVVTAGTNPKDRLAPVLGEYSGGRGSSDSTFDVPVMSPGIYAVRLIWENGAGEGTGNGANLEWFVVDTNGVKILINDLSSTNDTGVAAYYSGPPPTAYVSQINPYIGSGSAVPHKILVQLTDGSTTVNGGSIQFSIDGTAMPAPTVSKSGTVTTATLNLLNQPMTSGAHTAALVWTDSANTMQSNNWSFTVESYAVADSGQSVPATGVDTTQPGFQMHVAQLDFDLVGDGGDYIANQVDWANAMLAGSTFPWWGYNGVDTNSVPPVSSNLWYWTQAVDFNDVASAGDFAFDYTTPGIPGIGGGSQSFSKGLDGWLVFPQAGYYRMSISSDDGFRVSPGIGLLRQVLHIKGAKVDRDVATVVNDKLYGNESSFVAAPPPVVPITAPVFLVNSNNYHLGQAIDLTGKIAVADSGLYGASDALLAYIAQTNGALAFIELWPVSYGCPNMMGGTPPGPVNIPALVVNSYNGERDTWITNTDLTATIGASQNQIWGSADNGKGMGRIDIPVIIPTAGAYPVHMTYFQGTGNAGLEWQTYQGYDGVTLGATNMVIINDTTDSSSLVAYRAVKTLPTPTLSVSRQGTSYVITYSGVLRSSSTANGTYEPVSGAASPYTIPISSAPMMFYRAYQN